MIRTLIITLALVTTNLNAECLSPDPRFKTLDNDTVLDKTTGLTWMRCPYGMRWENNNCFGQSIRKDWRKATLAPNHHNKTAKANPWRLPTLKELESLVAKSCYKPSIDEATFPHTVPTGFWSITEDPESKRHAMIVFFLHGETYLSNKDDEWFVRLVKN